MIEDTYGACMVDDILDDCDLETGGSYTSVGTYNYTEFVMIACELSNQIKVPVDEVIKQYGRHFFFRFNKIMPQFFEKPTCAFDFLESIHDTIHVEVKKLYPDSPLPNLETHIRNEQNMDLVYVSQRPLADFTEGLILGCADFYDETISLRSVDNNTDEHFCRVFNLTRH